MKNMLDSDEHERARYELFQRCEAFITHNETMSGYAVAFVLFDVVGQLSELNKKLDSLNYLVGNLCECMPDKDK